MLFTQCYHFNTWLTMILFDTQCCCHFNIVQLPACRCCLQSQVAVHCFGSLAEARSHASSGNKVTLCHCVPLLSAEPGGCALLWLAGRGALACVIRQQSNTVQLHAVVLSAERGGCALLWLAGRGALTRVIRQRCNILPLYAVAVCRARWLCTALARWQRRAPTLHPAT
jgi:hypothetical protein